MNKTCEILSWQCNAYVVQAPERRYPGVVIQGDSLHIVIGLLKDAMASLPDGLPGEGKEYVELALEKLEPYQQLYVRTLRERNMDLPWVEK